MGIRQGIWGVPTKDSVGRMLGTAPPRKIASCNVLLGLVSSAMICVFSVRVAAAIRTKRINMQRDSKSSKYHLGSGFRV